VLSVSAALHSYFLFLVVFTLRVRVQFCFILECRYNCRKYRLTSYITVIGSRSRSCGKMPKKTFNDTSNCLGILTEYNPLGNLNSGHSPESEAHQKVCMYKVSSRTLNLYSSLRDSQTFASRKADFRDSQKLQTSKHGQPHTIQIVRALRARSYYGQRRTSMKFTQIGTKA